MSCDKCLYKKLLDYFSIQFRIFKESLDTKLSREQLEDQKHLNFNHAVSINGSRILTEDSKEATIEKLNISTLCTKAFFIRMKPNSNYEDEEVNLYVVNYKTPSLLMIDPIDFESITYNNTRFVIKLPNLGDEYNGATYTFRFPKASFPIKLQVIDSNDSELHMLDGSWGSEYSADCICITLVYYMYVNEYKINNHWIIVHQV